MDKHILITGATGNVGYETIRELVQMEGKHKIIAGDYNLDRAQDKLAEFKNLEFRKIDFTDASTFTDALDNVDIVFLLRPPQLADIPKYFEPFMDQMTKKGVQKIVFLSVHGVEEQEKIPHHKIEKLIFSKQLEYVFLRPGYFMQNLTTTLIREIKEKDKIFIPTGRLKFNWVDARDIGAVAAHILHDFDRYRNDAFEITGQEFLSFKEVAEILSEILGRNIIYESPNLLKFYFSKRKQGLSSAMIYVMIMLHYLPRFKKNEPRLTTTVKKIAGSEPHRLKDFIIRESEKFN